VVEVEPWYQSDHSLFVQQGIPAVALTSAAVEALIPLTHTPADTLDIVDAGQVSEATAFICQVVSAELT
jgi:aminopeptidase YwaD